jgi:hypothetical protein
VNEPWGQCYAFHPDHLGRCSLDDGHLGRHGVDLYNANGVYRRTVFWSVDQPSNGVTA